MTLQRAIAIATEHADSPACEGSLLQVAIRIVVEAAKQQDESTVEIVTITEAMK